MKRNTNETQRVIWTGIVRTLAADAAARIERHADDLHIARDTREWFNECIYTAVAA